MIVVLSPNIPKNKAIATSFTSGEVIKNENVTPKGIPPLTKPIKSGTEEHEQKGVTTPNMDAIRYSKPYILFRDRKFLTFSTGK